MLWRKNRTGEIKTDSIFHACERCGVQIFVSGVPSVFAVENQLMTGPQFLMDAWRRLCGLPEPQAVPPLESLRRTEWSEEFEAYMRNRLVLGAMRYGLLRGPGKRRYDRTQAIQCRLEAYCRTGNLEALVDIANLAMCEFIESHHPDKHFRSVDDGDHVQPN